jgi:prephenate dehydrogenase
LPDSDLIILAAPVLAILELLKDLGRFHPTPAVVIDLGSTKNQIVKAMTDLPGSLTWGHPMCGKKRYGD